MSAAVVALWRAIAGAAKAGTLRQSILDGIALATWALQHPAMFGAAVDLMKMSSGGDLGDSAAVESPEMEHAAGDKPGGR